MHLSMATTQPARHLILPLQILLFLRFGQAACATLTVYASMFYIGFYVWYRHQPAPPAEYLILFACIVSIFEGFFVTVYTIFSCCTAEIPRLNYRLYLVTSTITTLLSWRAYSWLRQVPWLRYYGEGNNNGIYYYTDSVERGTCAINDLIIITGALMVLFTALIMAWAAWGLWHDENDVQGAIRLEDEHVDHEDSDAVLKKCVIG